MDRQDFIVLQKGKTGLKFQVYKTTSLGPLSHNKFLSFFFLRSCDTMLADRPLGTIKDFLKPRGQFQCKQ